LFSDYSERMRSHLYKFFSSIVNFYKQYCALLTIRDYLILLTILTVGLIATFGIYKHIHHSLEVRSIRADASEILIVGGILTLVLCILGGSLLSFRARAFALLHTHAKLKAQYSRLDELAQKNQKLQEAHQMKIGFLANVSHELRTPLNAIIGFSELLKDEVPGTLNLSQKNFCDNIYKSGQHLLTIINDILDLSKIESGTLTFQSDIVNLSQLVEESVRIIHPKAQEKHIQFELKLDAQLKTVIIDSVKLKQILFNLLSNAIKFTPEGGRVTIKAGTSNTNFTIAVSDTGIGISDQDMARLFKPFVQLDNTLSRQFEGTGLGLVILKHLTELQGGTVTVSSVPQKGSCFTVRFPQHTAAL